MAQHTLALGLEVNVRVNPANAQLTSDNPLYREQYDRKLGELRAVYLEAVTDLMENGELTLPEIPSEGARIHDLFRGTPEGIAGTLAIREMNLSVVLGGYGLVGSLDEICYWDATIRWIPDESVDVGTHVLEDAQNGDAILAQLRSLG